MHDPTILAFDTSGPFCSVALWRTGRIVSEAYADMARGQAETLMPMIADLMGEAQIGRRHLSCIGVGIGPGNFTGLRISVAAARGIALGLGIPAIGVSNFELLLAATGDQSPRTLLSLPAPRDHVYLQMAETGKPLGEACLQEPGAIACQADLVVGEKADALAELIPGAKALPFEMPRTAPLIAQLAATRAETNANRPSPLYIRPADAAPSRHQPPVRLS